MLEWNVLFHLHTVLTIKKNHILPHKPDHIQTLPNTIFSDSMCKIKTQSSENCLKILSDQTQKTKKQNKKIKETNKKQTKQNKAKQKIKGTNKKQNKTKQQKPLKIPKTDILIIQTLNVLMAGDADLFIQEFNMKNIPTKM